MIVLLSFLKYDRSLSLYMSKTFPESMKVIFKKIVENSVSSRFENRSYYILRRNSGIVKIALDGPLLNHSSPCVIYLAHYHKSFRVDF